MERLAGILIGLVIAGVIVGGVLMLVGGTLLAALTAVASFPLAFPMTTAAVAIVLAVLWLKHRRTQRQQRRRDGDR